MVDDNNVGYNSDTDLILNINSKISFNNNVFDSNVTTTETNHSSIYKLPSDILLQICSYLQQYDLVNLCLSSKIWSFPATSTLYSKIIVNDDSNALKTIRKVITKYTSNFGTLISITKFQRLLYSINNNPSLGRLLKSLILNVNDETMNLLILTTNLSAGSNIVSNNIGNDNCDYSIIPLSPNTPCSRPQSPLSPTSKKSSTSLSSVVSSGSGVKDYAIKLNSLIAPNIPITYFLNNLNQFNLSSITMLSISIKDLSISDPTLLHFQNLQKLKLYYDDNEQNSANLSKLGETLMLNGSLSNLRELEFVEQVINDRITMLNIINDLTNSNFLNLPTWLYFFQSLSTTHSSSKLLLDSLAIEGFIGNKSIECVDMLSQSIDLSYLANLQLKMKESTHTNTFHNEFTTTSKQFLNLLTQKTSSLVSLAINPTFDCLNCQHQSIIQTIQYNLPNQLKNLSVVFESPSVTISQNINDTICKYQQNLERLLVNDKSTEITDRSLLFKCINSNQNLLNLYDHGLIYEKLIKNSLFNDVWLQDFLKLDEEFIINDQMISFINKSSGKGLNEYLWYFLHFAFSPIVSSKIKLIGNLPNLKNLNVLGLSLVINDSNKKLINNYNNFHPYNQKALQEIYYVANGKYISSGLTFKK